MTLNASVWATQCPVPVQRVFSDEWMQVTQEGYFAVRSAQVAMQHAVHGALLMTSNYFASQGAYESPQISLLNYWLSLSGAGNNME